jgi:hypothetical protein
VLLLVRLFIQVAQSRTPPRQRGTDWNIDYYEPFKAVSTKSYYVAVHGHKEHALFIALVTEVGSSLNVTHIRGGSMKRIRRFISLGGCVVSSERVDADGNFEDAGPPHALYRELG